MTQKNPILVLSCLLVVLPIALTAECPSKEDVAPCICVKTYSMIQIECRGIDIENLSKVARNLRGVTVYSFTITDSKLGFIPHDVFKGVKIHKLEIEKSTLNALTDKGEAFVGLEDHLEQLSIRFCVFKNEWDWFVLRSLKKLKYLTIMRSIRLETLGKDVMKYSISSSVTFFYFTGNDISFVSDHAFDSFKDVSHLTLSNNKIKNVKRTMLPSPALKLISFDISNNLIEQIPRDMFTKMPNLQSLDIGYNKILVLNERTFSTVWENLNTFTTLGNPLRCDCSMFWLPEKRTPDFLLGKCASPPELQGKELTKLEEKDFVCYV